MPWPSRYVYRWARVENVAPDSRGPFVDGRQLAVLEAFFGEPFDVTTAGGRFISKNPTTALMGERLGQSWQLLFDGILHNLIVQSGFGGLFRGAVYDIATDAPLLVGRVEDIVAALAAQTPSDVIDAIDYWKLFGTDAREPGQPDGAFAERAGNSVRRRPAHC